MRSFLLAAELTLAVLCAVDSKPALKAEPGPTDLTGIYLVVGNDGEKSYTGSCLMVKAGVGYVVLWSTLVHTENGLAMSQVKGTGLRKGDTLSVSWGNDKMHGVTIYAVQEKRLVGEWTQSGALGRKNTETLSRLAGLPSEIQ